MRKKRISADNNFHTNSRIIISRFQSRDLGQGEYVDCKALMAKVEKQDPQRIVLREVLKRTT